MSKKLMTGLLALVALAALALPAVASASPEIGETSGGVFTKLAVGSKIKATNVGNTLMTNSSGGILTECNAATLTGELTKNSGTEIEGNVTSATFTGTGSESRCTATFGNSTVTPTVTAEGGAHGLPWCIKAGGALEKDEMTVRGGKCSEAARDIRFILDVLGGVECEYQRTTAIPGTFTTDTSGQDATTTITKQKFSRIRGSALVCPSEGFLDMTFTLETDTETASPLYIK
jgi:hypothetical protein